MKLVKFKDGTYGVRRLTLFWGWEYLDFKFPQNNFWWTRTYVHFHDCRTTKENAEKWLAYRQDKGTPV